MIHSYVTSDHHNVCLGLEF